MPMSIALALSVMLTLPGWAILALSGSWRRYPGLQGWSLAVGLSVATYPVLLYGVRALAPGVRITPLVLAAALGACSMIVAWRLRRTWRVALRLAPLEWLAVAAIGLTLATRLWVLRAESFPAWSDSLHHTLITQLTAAQGRLPNSLAPYLPIPLGQYHLGLYALSAALAWLSGAAPHTALLVIAQVLNGLCGLGVYLALDRLGSRVGAVVGLIVVGLLAHQPAWYVNWGRFTQVASQTLLLIAWVATGEALRRWRDPQTSRAERLWAVAIAALLGGAVTLLHFRVAAFYLPLVGLTALAELRRGQAEGRLAATLGGGLLVGLGTLALVAPAVFDALRIYLAPDRLLVPVTSPAAEASVQSYFGLPLEAIPLLSAEPWLLGLAGAALLAGLAARNPLTILVALWSATLIASGLLYLSGIWRLAFVNLSGVLIVAYLPVALLIGAAVGELVRRSGRRLRLAQTLALALVCAGGLIAAPIRAQALEPYRYFVTPADVQAMGWISANTPPDARFAVNTTFWLPLAPHGTDGGYWIGYFTGRQTTAGVMINNLGTSDYLAAVVARSNAVEQLEHDPSAVATLRAAGVSHIYIGPRGDFSGPGLNPDQLRQNPGLALVYEQDGVFIFRIR